MRSTGIRLSPDDLRAVLAGCVRSGGEATVLARSAMTGSRWIWRPAVSVYLQRFANCLADRGGTIRRPREIDYAAFAGDRPSQIVLRGKDLDLALAGQTTPS
jgi:hypothetical protein